MLVLLAAACAATLTGTATAQAHASAARHAGSNRVKPPRIARSSIAGTASAAHGLVPLARVVDDQKTRSALKIDASDEPSFDKLTRLITGASYLAGVGFAVGAILKFKAHKDNPRQTVLGKPTALVFIGASIPFIDKAAAIAGASLFSQASRGTGGRYRRAQPGRREPDPQRTCTHRQTCSAARSAAENLEPEQTPQTPGRAGAHAVSR